MAISLVQFTLGGSISAAGLGNASTPFTTSAVGFPSPTTPGNLLLCVIWGDYQSTKNPTNALNIQIPTTLGFTWVHAHIPSGWVTGSTVSPPVSAGSVEMYYIENASSMSGTTTVTATVLGAAATAYNVQFEFALFEFSGVDISGSLEQQKNVNGGSASSPNPGSITTLSNNDLLFAIHCGNRTGSNAIAGSGYALGPNATVAVLGQDQYQIVGAAGTYASAFNGSIPNWGAQVFAFKPPLFTEQPRIYISS